MKNSKNETKMKIDKKKIENIKSSGVLFMCSFSINSFVFLLDSVDNEKTKENRAASVI